MRPDIELSVAVAREVMGWTSLGAHLWHDRQTDTVYYTGHDPTRVFVPHTVFDPSRDPQQVRIVEEQIEHLGKRQAYIAALIREVELEEHAVNVAYAAGYPSPEEAPVVQQALLHASPTQRSRAAVQAVRDAGN